MCLREAARRPTPSSALIPRGHHAPETPARVVSRQETPTILWQCQPRSGPAGLVQSPEARGDLVLAEGRCLCFGNTVGFPHVLGHPQGCRLWIMTLTGTSPFPTKRQSLQEECRVYVQVCV